MKKDIHPKYYPNAKVTCGCGNAFTVGSTKEAIRVEVCSRCHPYYTGTQQFLDTAGRVERFTARRSKAVARGARSKNPRVAKNKK
ncbi:MAG: 50S ribosomal protein L31 [Patescibacteria group bacterium]